MSVHFSPSIPPTSPPRPSSGVARLVALKAQIRKRNATLGSSARPSHALSRRRSLLTLHQQAMELMSPESLDPFTEDTAEDATNSSKGQHRREKTENFDEKEAPKAPRNRRASILAQPPFHVKANSRMDAASLLLSTRATVAQKEVQSVKLTRRQMRELLSHLNTAHPALVTHSGEEEKEDTRAPPPSINTDKPNPLFASTLPSISSPSPPSPSSSPASSDPVVLSSSPFPPPAPATPRLAFSQKRVEKFDESVKVMMSFSHSDMELIRTEILKRGGGVNRSQFLAIAVKKRPSDDGYEREVEALAEMFEEIDVNGDGDLQYSEFTSYLVELANGRYDHHHIDQLLHTDYHHLEPVTNDDRIDVMMVRWYEAIGHFIVFEKGQHRFKVLDSQKKTVKVVRGHGGEMIDCEWLPSHGVLVTSSNDRTLRFWSVDDRVKTKEGKDVVKAVDPSRAPLSRVPASSVSSSSPSFPTFNCLSVWALPSPQVSLCWTKSRLYSADILGRLLMWNIDVGEIRMSTQAHEGRVTALIPAAEEGVLISGGMDGRVKVWDCMDLKCIGEWRHEGVVRSLAWDGERRVALSGGDDDCVRVWDARTRSVKRTLSFRVEGHEREARKKEAEAAARQRRRPHSEEDDIRVDSGDSILGLSLTSDEEMLVMSQYGVIRVVDLTKWTVEQTLILPRVWDDHSRDDEEESEDSEEEAVEESKDASSLSLRARQLVTSFTCVRSSPTAAPLPLAFSSSPAPPRENVMVVSAGSSLYSFTRNSAVNHFIADSHPVLCSIYNPVSFSIITAAHRSLKVWDCITGRLLKEFHDIVPKGSTISSACLDGRGRKVIVAGTDGRVCVFNCNTGAEMQHLDTHEGEVLNLQYIEEVVREEEKEGEAEAEGINKVLCSSRRGVYIHLDDHEAESNSSYTSLYHASFDHRSDITALTESSPFGLIVSASSDPSIIVYPANLDGTPLQKLHIGSQVTCLLFLHPYRLLLVAAGQGSLQVHCVTSEQNVRIGEWTNLSSLQEPANVMCVAFDAFTETLYTGDESGCIKGWPLTLTLFDPFRALLSEQGLLASSTHLPERGSVKKFFPRGLTAVEPSLVIVGHGGSVTSVAVIDGREGKWSTAANAAAERREAAVQREEEEWREAMKESYESAVYRTAQLLYEGSAAESGRLSPRSPRGRRSPRASFSSQADLARPPSSALPMADLLNVLPPPHIAQLNKERKRISRQLQLEFDQHFASARAANVRAHADQLHHLDLTYGSPTSVLSSGVDGCVHLWSTEVRGECLGSLQQGEVATLGRGTPSQWRFYVNIEQRKAWERDRLTECVREVEEERAAWKEGEEKREEEEEVARQLREEELAGREEEEDPNDLLPFSRAATKEQKKLMEKVEQDSTKIIKSEEFKSKVHPRKPGDSTRTSPAAFPSIHTTSSSTAQPNLPSPSFAASSSVPLPTISGATPSPARSVPSLQLDAPSEPGRRRRSSQYRSRAASPPDEKTPSLQLSRVQLIKAAIAKAVPLHPRESEEEEAESVRSVRGGSSRAAAAERGSRGTASRAQKVGDTTVIAQSLARQLKATTKAQKPPPSTK